LDGLHYYERNKFSYIKKNLKIRLIYDYFSDYKIFQSEYSRRQCFEIFHPIDVEKYTIIFNACNRDIFYSNQKKSIQDKISFITTGSFRHLDMIKPIIDALDLLKIDFSLKVIGPISKELIPALNRSYVQIYGSQNPAEMAEQIRNSDVFLFSALNSACPNALIEAVSCGVPVIAYSSGAVPEICHFSPDLIIPTPDKILHKISDFNVEEFSQKVLKCVGNYSYYKALANQYSDLYDLKKMGEAYFNYFKLVSSSTRL
jgi:glycosyltransferase involved in cell wall biosynthesis